MTEPTSPPPFACLIWHDARNLYLQYPSRPGQAPAIVTFPLTEGGLGKALTRIQGLPAQPDPRILGGARMAKNVIPLPPRVTVVRRKDVFDDSLRASARAALRRLKIGG